MKPFFQDYQIRKYTHDEKIKWVFKYLFTKLKPVELTTRNERAWTTKGNPTTYKIIFAECISLTDTQIKVPFPDISLSISEEFIIILGDNFKYQFAPNMILTVWMRLKIVLK
jgi:hypothetical protein